MISSFCKSMYLSYFRFQSNAWRDEGVIFFHSQVSQRRRCEVFYLLLKKKKQVLLKSKSLPLKTVRVLQRILTIFVKSKELSTASPNFRREQALAHSCFLVFNQTRGKTRVGNFYSQVSQWRSYEFFFVLYSLSEKKKTGTDNSRSAKFDCPVIWKMNLTASVTC